MPILFNANRCPYCYASLELAHYVHGHLACGSCGLNIGPCCEGETAWCAPDDSNGQRDEAPPLRGEGHSSWRDDPERMRQGVSD